MPDSVGAAVPALRVRVAVINSHATEREGLSALLARESALDVVGAAPLGNEALDLIKQAEPQVVVLDVPDECDGGVQVLCRLAGLPVAPRVVALRRAWTRTQVTAAFEVGASACISTDAGKADLFDAVQAASVARMYVCPFVARTLASSTAAEEPPPRSRHLTGREREVLSFIAEGRTDRAIASCLALAVGTVHTHRKHIMAKLGVHNVTGLLRRARDLGLLPPP